jgi:hypothetical protein
MARPGYTGETLKRLLLGFALLSVGAPPCAAPTQEKDRPAPLSYGRNFRPLLETYCFRCHGAEKPKGGLNLSAFKEDDAVGSDPKTWQKVLRQLRDEQMPPENRPQPAPEERDLLIHWLEGALERVDYSKLVRDPGRTLIHRLSHAEYNNTVRDLFGVEVRPASRFPTDGSGGSGFDNIADTLFVPPILMERYLEAAGEVLAAARPERLFVARPGPGLEARAAARRVAEHFARRAFRRPAEAEEVERLLRLYDGAARRGEPFEAGVRLVLKAILVSPKFLFRIYRDQPTDQPYPIGEFELASRLSYFLWSSTPDDPLLELAEKSRLREPGVLEAQVRRMLADPRSRALSETFASQWLGLDTLRASVVRPDPRKFPEFTDSLKEAMIAEALDFFHGIVREDRSILELLHADYTYLNEELARHYGIAGVTGREMRKVPLSDETRGGVLSMAGILTLTSYPLRTSPVVRGKWILEEIFGAPAPPPPQNVGLLPANDTPVNGLSFRQRLELHRQKPQCIGCHKRIDPIGFGLENYDPIGRWRRELSGQPVDASGVLPTGEKFNGPAELKRLLLRRKEDFVRNFSDKLLSFALGRGVESYDAPALKKITDALAQGGHRSGVLITEIAGSFPFQYRRNAPIQARGTK